MNKTQEQWQEEIDKAIATLNDGDSHVIVSRDENDMIVDYEVVRMGKDKTYPVSISYYKDADTQRKEYESQADDMIIDVPSDMPNDIVLYLIDHYQHTKKQYIVSQIVDADGKTCGYKITARDTQY